MKRPKVSIIIPIFNGSQFLGQCLESIRTQTFDDFEVICFDDHSTDHSLKILEKYMQRDPRLTLIRMPKNFGQHVLRNKGLQRARGDLIYFIDDDDFIEKDYIERLAQQALRTKADICICGGDEYWHIEKKYRRADWIFNAAYLPQKQVFKAKDCPETIFQICGESPWARILRKEFIKKHHLQFDHLPVFEDFPFSIKCLTLADKITSVDKPLYHHRKHPRNASSWLWNHRVNFEALLITKAFLESQGDYQTYKLSFLNKCMYAINWRFVAAANETIRQNMLEELRSRIFFELELEKEHTHLSKASQEAYHAIRNA